MHLRMLARALVALALPLAGLAAVATPARADLATGYAALGDSYSSGVGAGPYDSSGCERSQRSYPPLWVGAHAVDTFRFAACGGAETTDVLNTQLSALDVGIDLVTVTIGGNDAGFADTMITCQFGSQSACAAAVTRFRTFATTSLPALLDRTYAAVRERAPAARLVVLGYPRLFELTSGCGLLGMSLAKRRLLNDGADALVGVISARASVAGATFVDVRSVFAGHGLCGSSPWINGITTISDAFHPTATGYRSGYLAALTAAIG